MKECWINVYSMYDGAVYYGHCWHSINSALLAAADTSYPPIYRIHVKLKNV